MSYTRIGAAFVVLAFLAAVLVACQAEVNSWSRAPDAGIELDIDHPKSKRPKAPAYRAPKAPSYKAPTTRRR